MPKSSGSVGKNIFIGNPGINSLSCKDKGVEKAINNKSLSNENIANKKNIKTNGSNKNINFFVATKYALAAKNNNTTV